VLPHTHGALSILTKRQQHSASRNLSPPMWNPGQAAGQTCEKLRLDQHRCVYFHSCRNKSYILTI